MPQKFRKDPQAILDYKFDWAEWLAEGETISDATVTADAGLTVDSNSVTDAGTSVTVWLSGGEAGNNYQVSCEVVTSDARTDQRTIAIQVREL